MSSRICRTCLNTSDVTYNLFGADSARLGETKVSVAEFMDSCFQLAMKENEIVPPKICDKCYQEIQRIYTFKAKCEHSQIVLSQLRDVQIKLRKVKTTNSKSNNSLPDTSVSQQLTPSRIQIIKDELLTETVKKVEPCATTKYVEIIDDPLNMIEFERLGGNLLNSGTEMDVDDVVIKEEQLSDTASVYGDGENISHSFLSETSTIMEAGACMSNAQERECPACPYVHVSESGLKKHMIRDHMSGNECSICNKPIIGNPQDHFSIHLVQNVDFEEMIPKIALLERNVQCQYCPETVKSLRDLDEHVAGYHKFPNTNKLNTNIGNNYNVVGNVLETNEKDPLFNEIIEEIFEDDIYDDRTERCMKFDSKMNDLEQLILASTPKTSQEELAFQCRTCAESFSQKEELIAHLRTHVNYKGIKCDLCSQTFKFQHNLDCHMRFKHCIECKGDTNADCEKCSMKSSNMKNYECGVCQKIFNTKSSLFRHRKVHGIDMKFKCNLCPKSFNYKQILQLHMKEKHTETSPKIPNKVKLECNECSETFDDRQTLGEHLKALEPIRQHKCPHCPKCFEFHGNLILHLSSHMVENGSWCAICLVKFESERHLETHVAEKHAKAVEDIGCHTCEQCGKAFTIRRHYEEHLQTHTKENLFACDICKMPFRYMQSLTRHMKTFHTDNAPTYQCQLCTKSFRDRCDLVKHFRSHTGEKPFECDICSEKFADKIQLGAHKVLQHDGKNIERQYFKCDQCTKVFWTRSHFEEHQRSHNKQGTLSCHICGKSFRQKQSLKLHMKRLHPSNGDAIEYNVQSQEGVASNNNAVVMYTTTSFGSLALDNSNQLVTLVQASNSVMNEMFDESSIEVA